MPRKQTAVREEVEAPATHVEKRSAKFVIVGCKVPNGLALQLCQAREVAQQIMGGGTRLVKEFQRVGQVYEVVGPSYPVGQVPQGFPRRPVIVGGYAITRNIPADFWQAWAEQNADTDIVRNKQLIAWPQMEDVEAEGKENAKRPSGLEPLNPDGDPRMARSANKNVRARGGAAVETADEQSDPGRRKAEFTPYEDTE